MILVIHLCMFLQHFFFLRIWVFSLQIRSLYNLPEVVDLVSAKINCKVMKLGHWHGNNCRVWVWLWDRGVTWAGCNLTLPRVFNLPPPNYFHKPYLPHPCLFIHTTSTSVMEFQRIYLASRNTIFDPQHMLYKNDISLLISTKWGNNIQRQ